MLAVLVLHQFFDGAGDASIPQPAGIQDYRPTRFRTFAAPLRATSKYYFGHDSDWELGPDDVSYFPIVYAEWRAPLRAALYLYRPLHVEDAVEIAEYADDGSNLRVLLYGVIPAPLRAAARYYVHDDGGAGDAPAPAETAHFYPTWRGGTRRR